MEHQPYAQSFQVDREKYSFLNANNVYNKYSMLRVPVKIENA